MRTLRSILALGALSLAAAAPAGAQQTGQFRFLQGSPVYAFNTSVGTYKAQLDLGGGFQNIDVWCVDFLNHVRPNDQFQVNVTGLGGSPDLSKTRFGSLAQAAAGYQKAAWLATQFSTSTMDAPTWGAIHAAIWHLMTPGKPSLSAHMTTQANWWLDQAEQNYGRYSYGNVYVLSDAALARCTGTAPYTGCAKQEQLYINGQLQLVPPPPPPPAPPPPVADGDDDVIPPPPGLDDPLTVTPEPATMGLLAIGLAGLGGVTLARRRRQRRGD